MSAMRTQVYFTTRQRQALDDLAQREGKTLAAVVRAAVDAYVTEASGDPDVLLAETFGSIPDLRVPDRGTWDRGFG